MSRLKRAVSAFEDFKGEKPTRVRRARLPDNDVTGWQMGPVVGIAYEARRDGKTAQYFHEFKKAARPNLVSQDDGRKLYIEGGRYKVTDRGIEDMPNLFVVNPSPRSGRSSKRKGSSMARSRARRRRSPAVTVFTANPRRRRRRARSTYRRNPAPRRRRSVYRANPRRRHGRRRAFRRNPGPASVYRSNPRRRSRARRYRRNPIGGSMKFMDFILPAILVGAGGVLAEVITGYLPIPANWKVGYPRLLVKAGVGIAAGFLLARVLKQKKAGFYIAAGAVVLAAHDLIKMLIVTNAPNVKGLSGMGYGPPMPGQFGFVNPGALTKFSGAGMGYGPTMRQPFGGDAPIVRPVGGEWQFAY